jgi:hypothetical protein
MNEAIARHSLVRLSAIDAMLPVVIARSTSWNAIDCIRLRLGARIS